MNTVIIETIVSVLANLAVTLIGVLGAWLLAQISKSEKLGNIQKAVAELTTAAENTVLEAAGVDVNAIVTGAGEALIAKMKKEEKTNG